MYAPGTILKLREPRPPITQIEGEEEVEIEFPFNVVRVIGPSPVSHASGDGWSGQGASGVIIEPLASFDTNLDEPFGKLMDLYEVVSEPEPVEIDSKVRVVRPGELGPSPEDRFAAEQREAGIKKSETRVPTQMNPLDMTPEEYAEQRAEIEKKKKALRGEATDSD